LGGSSATSFQILLQQACDLTLVGMAVGEQLGEEQLVVDDELEAPAIRGDQGERFDLRFVILQQFGCQTDSPWGVVSNSTVGNGYF
jgi:hypothetical protein